jgi:uncharacterized membrane protein YGL010W
MYIILTVHLDFICIKLFWILQFCGVCYRNRKPVPFLYGTWEGLFVCCYIGVMLYPSVGTSGSGVTRLDHIHV